MPSSWDRPGQLCFGISYLRERNHVHSFLVLLILQTADYFSVVRRLPLSSNSALLFYYFHLLYCI